MDKHTFVICAYKKSRYLERCILSLKKQTVAGNIIMITSTPNQFVDEMADKYGIPLLINKNGGIVQDWNFAYNHANTEYVTIAHQDDVYFPQFVERVIRRMDGAKDPIICFTNYVEIRANKMVVANRLLRIKRLMLLPFRIRKLQERKWVRRMILALGSPICCPSVTFSKEKVGKAPFSVGFRSDEDWEAWERLSRLSGTFVYESGLLMGHRIHQESETTNILNDNARTEEDYIMFKKFWPDFIARRLAKIYSISEKSNRM